MKGWGGKTGTEEDRGDLDDIISKELKDPANHGISFFTQQIIIFGKVWTKSWPMQLGKTLETTT